jgi:hypothetical protein
LCFYCGETDQHVIQTCPQRIAADAARAHGNQGFQTGRGRGRGRGGRGSGRGSGRNNYNSGFPGYGHGQYASSYPQYFPSPPGYGNQMPTQIANIDDTPGQERVREIDESEKE